jgi:Fe/S biogenesis protein NfuA
MIEVDITESAQKYLAELLEKQNAPGIAVRMFVNDPGTSRAETCIAYCRPGEEKEGDERVEFPLFSCYFDGRSLLYLKDAKVDYSADRMGGQLTIKAPNSKMPQVKEDSSIEDRINYVLYTEVNPPVGSAQWRSVTGANGRRCRNFTLRGRLSGLCVGRPDTERRGRAYPDGKNHRSRRCA